MEEQITFNPRNSLRFLELIPDLEVWSEHLLKDEDPDIQVIGEDIRKIGELLKALIPEDFPPRPEGGRVPMLGKCDRIFAWRDGVLTKSLTLDTGRSKRYYDLVRDIGPWGEELRASKNPRIEGIGVEVGLIVGVEFVPAGRRIAHRFKDTAAPRTEAGQR